MSDEMHAAAPEAPRYRLTEPAWINARLCAAGDEIEYGLAPGWHMQPLNEAATAMKVKYPSYRPGSAGASPSLPFQCVIQTPGSRRVY